MYTVYHVGNTQGPDRGRFNFGYCVTRSDFPVRFFEEPGFFVVQDGFQTEKAAVEFMKHNDLPMYRGDRPPDMNYDPNNPKTW
jgi:hypothetical protein